MSTLVKNKKKQSLSPKAAIFWSLICAITLVLVVSLIVLFIQNYKANSKDDIEYLTGNEIFTQKEDTYFVSSFLVGILIFLKHENEELEYFDKVVLNYQSFLKKYEGKKVNGEEKAFKLYGVDTALPENYKIVVSKEDEEKISGTSKITDAFISDTDSSLLRIYENHLPTLLVITEGKVTNYVTGRGSVSKYLQEIIDLYEK